MVGSSYKESKSLIWGEGERKKDEKADYKNG